MLEPIEVTSLDDLGDVVMTVDITRPDGKAIRVKLRCLTDGEAWNIRKSIKWPKPAIKDYQKVGAEALPVYDYQGEDYLAATREADRKLARQIIAASLVLDIPGDTLDAKADALEKKLGQWAFAYLIGVVNKISIVDQEAIDNAMRSFRSVTGGSTASHDSSGVDA